jgi:hypothetical protein
MLTPSMLTPSTITGRNDQPAVNDHPTLPENLNS